MYIKYIVTFRDRGETDPSCYISGNHVTKLREEIGQKEMSSHFVKKCGFADLEFDGKKSKTKQTSGQLICQSNVTCISDGSFLEFFQPDDDTGLTYGIELHKIVKKYLAEESLIYIGSDSTAVNTGCYNGAIASLEKLMGKQLFWVSFMYERLDQQQKMI